MTEPELITMLADVMKAEGARRGVSFLVVRSHQESHQGRDLAQAIVYISLVTSNPNGWERKEYRNDPTDPEMVLQGRRELWHTTFQLSGQAGPTGPTAIDLLTLARGAFSSDAGRVAMRALGALPFQPGAIREIWLTDEGQRFESHPSFDVTISHSREMTDSVAKIAGTSPDFAPI